MSPDVGQKLYIHGNTIFLYADKSLSDLGTLRDSPIPEYAHLILLAPDTTGSSKLLFAELDVLPKVPLSPLVISSLDPSTCVLDAGCVPLRTVTGKTKRLQGPCLYIFHWASYGTYTSVVVPSPFSPSHCASQPFSIIIDLFFYCVYALIYSPIGDYTNFYFLPTSIFLKFSCTIE